MSNFFGGLFDKKNKNEKPVKKPDLDKDKKDKKDESIPDGLGGSKLAAQWIKEDEQNEKASSPAKPSEKKKADEADTADKKSEEKPATKPEPEKKDDDSKKNSSKTEEKVKASTDDKKSEEKRVSVSDETDLKTVKNDTRPKDPTKPIIVRFVYKGKKIRNDFIFTNELGTHLKLRDLPTVPGYKLDLKTNFNYKISHVEQTVVLHYRKDQVKYNLVPVLEDKTPIDKTKVRHLEGLPDDEISASKYPQIKGYRPYTRRKYTVPQDGGDVEVTYTKTKQTITIIFQTEKGEVLGTDKKHGLTGEDYKIDVRKRHFPGYELAKLPNNLSGKFPAENMQLEVICAPVASSITVIYVDEKGKEIHARASYSSPYKSPYTIKLPTIDGYELTSNPSVLNGYYDKVPKNIVLHYKRATQTFTIRYWFDKDFKHSAGEDSKVSGLVGDPFDFPIPEKEGYTANTKEVKGKFSPFEEMNKDVDVVYTKIPCEVHVTLVDEADRPLPNQDSIVKKGNWGDIFEIELPDIPGFKRPFKVLKKRFDRAQQAELVHYTAQEVSLTIHYIDTKTKKEIDGYPAKFKPGLANTVYSVEPEMIDGYRLTKLPDNASGVYTAKPINVELLYEPNPSEIVVHRNAVGLETIVPVEVLTGYFGKPYEIKQDVPGYKFVSSSEKLKGTFPASRLDVYLSYESADVSFTLVPVDQFGKEIDPDQNIEIVGKAGQEFSQFLPIIPGYISTASEISGQIKVQYQGEKIEVPYKPKDEIITVHTIYSGGSNNGQHPFQDFSQPGPVGSTFEYEVPELPGYEPSTKKLVAKFEPEPQKLTIVYTVKREKYNIQFVDGKGQLVGGMPEGTGYYNEPINVEGSVPRGFHLQDGVDSNIYLDGSNTYRVLVIADRLTVELIAQTKNGMDLGSRRQVDGDYNEVKTYDALPVPGYTPVAGDKVQVKFDLNTTTYPIIYEPEERTITINYINASTGKAIGPKKKIIKKHFNEQYDISADPIPGYVAINRTRETGTIGLQNIEMTFIYRGSSDYLNNAATDIEQIIKNDQALRQSAAQSVVRPSQKPVVDVPPYTENEEVPTAKTATYYEEPVPESGEPQTKSSTPVENTNFDNPSVSNTSVSVDNTQTDNTQTGMPKGVDLIDKLYGPGMARKNEDNRQ